MHDMNVRFKEYNFGTLYHKVQIAQPPPKPKDLAKFSRKNALRIVVRIEERKAASSSPVANKVFAMALICIAATVPFLNRLCLVKV